MLAIINYGHLYIVTVKMASMLINALTWSTLMWFGHATSIIIVEIAERMSVIVIVIGLSIRTNSRRTIFPL